MTDKAQKVRCGSCHASMPFPALEGHLKKCPGWQRDGYICGIDYASELGEVPAGTKIFPTIRDLRKSQKCVSAHKGGCAIVKVRVSVLKIVKKGLMM